MAARITPIGQARPKEKNQKKVGTETKRYVHVKWAIRTVMSGLGGNTDGDVQVECVCTYVRIMSVKIYNLNLLI